MITSNAYHTMKNRNKNFRVKTASYSIDEHKDHGFGFSNKGASGDVKIVLPAAKIGMEFEFLVEAAQALQVDPNGTETIALPSTGAQGAAGGYLGADAIGESVLLKCVVAGTWNVVRYIGTWTAQA